MENSFEDFFFRYRWYLLAAGIGILLIILGLVSTTRELPWFESNKVEILNSQEENLQSTSSAQLVIEIAGSVQKPGVYTFHLGERVEDALVASGGLSLDADRGWVDRSLNRAAKLVDGQKIYVPKVGESDIKGSSTSSFGISSDNLVNINSASQAELESLPGIGPVTAQKIIEGRPYSGVEELLTRKIVGKSVFDKNKGKLSVY